MDIVTNTSPVVRIIIVTEDSEFFPSASSTLADEWNQVVRNSIRILTDMTAVMSATRGAALLGVMRLLTS